MPGYKRGVRYSALRVLEGGHVPLLDLHVARLGTEVDGLLRARLAGASPGAYRVWWDGTTLEVSPRPPSRLREGMPTRRHVSPFIGVRGRFQKPGPGSAYEPLRVEGMATLLTDAADTELYETDAAALIGWDGARFVLVPEDRPGVDSVAERAVQRALNPLRAVLAVDADLPVLLINAVAGSCAVELPRRPPFPLHARARLDAVLGA